MIHSTVSRLQQTIEIARRVENAARRRGLGLAEVASALTVHRSEASQILHGEREITVPELITLAQLTGVEPTDLLPSRGVNGSGLS